MENPPVENVTVKRVQRSKAGELVVTLTSRPEPVVDARVARCFPWTLPDSYVSIRDKDGNEVALLRSLSEVDAASREILEEELRDKVFAPRIVRVISHRREFGVISITAETDRGEVTFQVRSRDDIRHLSATRLLFRDADGNTYEVVDVMRMDPVSRRYLEEYV